MKKLLTLFAFAVGGILCVNAANISGTNFEQFTLKTGDDGNPIPATVIATDDLGRLSNEEGYANTFWGPADYAGVANVMTGTKVVKEGQSYPAIHAENDAQYLFVNTSGGTLVRNINLTEEGNPKQETIPEGGLYFDSMVQFTATESLSQQAVIGGTDKLIVWLKETTLDTADANGNTMKTNLVVTAAQITAADDGVAKDYEITNLEGFVPGQWYRLTIVAHPNAFSMANVPAFAVYVNETRAKYDSTESAIVTGDVTVSDSCLWLKDENAIFPSLQLDRVDYPQTINSVAFEGYGYVDDLEFSTGLPAFANAPAGLTIKWGEGIASIAVKKNGSEDVVIINPGQGEYEAAGTKKFDAGVYTIAANLVDGYFNNSLSTGEADASSDNVVLNFSAQKIYCKIGETNYASLEEALAYINDKETVVPAETKIVLYNDVDVAQTPLSIAKDIILDLAGKKISGNQGMVLAVAANVTIITSEEGGEIINGSDNQESSAVLVGQGATAVIGAIEGDEGVTITGWAFDGAGTIKLVRAAVEDKDGANGVSSYCDENSEITGTTTINDLVYSVVAPMSIEEPTTYRVTFEDGVEDAEIEVPVAQTVNSGDTASAPETAPTRDGYTFLGWFLKDGDTVATDAYDFANTTVTGSITLVAKWEAVVVEQPSVGGSTVAPEEVFNTANSQTGIAFKGTVTETTDSDGNKLLTFGTGTNPVKVPSYYKYTMTETTVDGQLETTIKLSLDETKVTPVIGATEAGENQDAIPAFKTEAGAVTIGVAETIPGLYYGIAVATSLGNNPKFTAAEGTLQPGDGNPLALTITKDANEKVKFFKVYVTDIAPKPTPAQ